MYGQLTLDFEVSETLENAQFISIQSLLANDLQGPTLFQLSLENNNTSERIEDLYFRIVFESNKIGRILEVRQVAGTPFSLDAGQRVYATNNNSVDGLPGIKETLSFEHHFTEAGRNFYNNLKGTTSLPADRYQVRVEVYRGSTSGELLASQADEIGANIAEDTRDFYLLAPGDELGSGIVISNRYPNFQWQGGTGGTYRLIVVESRNNESPESLMEGALSTEPIESVGTNGGGSLVDYEMLDVVVNGSGYQYPNSGVQDLEEDTQYYWRIINQLKTGSGKQERESEIWSFTLGDVGSASNSSQAGETVRALKQILGDRFEELQQNGFSLESIEIEGQTFRRSQAMQKLMELARKNNQGDVSIIIEN
ncbi:hypothetical protein [Fodinibius sp. Rm-B-1B1-1]|uniref:hypothetical protein n=1 Tax=Fodinibius alkaliphilus TaxID=3140241 RepID=UPI00315AEFAD